MTTINYLFARESKLERLLFALIKEHAVVCKQNGLDLRVIQAFEIEPALSAIPNIVDAGAGMYGASTADIVATTLAVLPRRTFLPVARGAVFGGPFENIRSRHDGEHKKKKVT